MHYWRNIAIEDQTASRRTIVEVDEINICFFMPRLSLWNILSAAETGMAPFALTKLEAAHVHRDRNFAQLCPYVFNRRHDQQLEL